LVQEALVTSARDAILSAVRAARPPVVSYPESVAAARAHVDLVARFEKEARTAAADVVHATRSELERIVAEWSGFVCEAEFGVAENGSVWLRGSRLGERSALFLASQVLVVLDLSAIAADLHAAYARIDMANEAFGIFVAGPSKTADIEQSLVVGAHGAKELTVVLVGD
jgi:L-lactate dehydrogenase complex protein LldG